MLSIGKKPKGEEDQVGCTVRKLPEMILRDCLEGYLQGNAFPAKHPCKGCKVGEARRAEFSSGIGTAEEMSTAPKRRPPEKKTPMAIEEVEKKPVLLPTPRSFGLDDSTVQAIVTQPWFRKFLKDFIPFRESRPRKKKS